MAAVLRFVGWSQRNTQTLILGIVAVVAVGLGGWYWISQRGSQLDAAAEELEMLQQTAGFEDPATATASIQGYLDRYAGTAYEIEGRMLLARVQLVGTQDPAAAIQTLQAVAPAFGSPLSLDATFMLAATFEQAERWEDAARVYDELRSRAPYAFQTKEAGEGLARASLARGDTARAIEVYESLLEEIPEDDPERPTYLMKLAELRAAGSA
jgi:predicted negative regulator of RcsB-dependent stress response